MRSYPTEVVLSITTGITLCEFKKMAECCEFLMGRPIQTLEFASSAFCNFIKGVVVKQHPQLAHVDANHVNINNWQEFLDEMIAKFGKELSLVSIAS